METLNLAPSKKKGDQKIEKSSSSMATDGIYLYVWQSASQVLEKIGTGAEGSTRGKIYQSNTNLLETILSTYKEKLNQKTFEEEETLNSKHFAGKEKNFDQVDQ